MAGPGTERRGGVAATLSRAVGDRRLAAGVAAGSAAAWGVIAGWWTPRGPLTTAEVLLTMAIGLAVGWVAGFFARTRWAILLAPVVFIVVFEITRAGASGPTVDAPATSTYGVLALIVGRGFHGLVALTPMALGAALGAGAARRPAATESAEVPTGRAGRYVGRGSAALTGIALLVLAGLVARPATTEPIVDEHGVEVPGSVAELTTVDVDGRQLGLMIRGSSTENPVLLFLAGGPGGSERGAMRNHLEALEKSFTVATWDQRGSGTSYPMLDPANTFTLESQIADTIAVTDHLRERFDQDEIFLVGQSWGSALGVLAVQEAPERYSAFIGVGQMVSLLDTDRRFYDDTLSWATEHDDALAEKLRAIGPPPYDRMLDYETALSYENQVYRYDHSRNSEGEGGFSENLFVSEYTLTDQVHLLGAFMDTFSVLYPQLQEIDFRTTATDFEVPVYFVQGAHEADGRAEVFDEWYAMVRAPIKDLVVFDTSGHRAMFEQPDEFVDYMTTTVLAQSADG